MTFHWRNLAMQKFHEIFPRLRASKVDLSNAARPQCARHSDDFLNISICALNEEHQFAMWVVILPRLYLTSPRRMKIPISSNWRKSFSARKSIRRSQVLCKSKSLSLLHRPRLCSWVDYCCLTFSRLLPSIFRCRITIEGTRYLLSQFSFYSKAENQLLYFAFLNGFQGFRYELT